MLLSSQSGFIRRIRYLIITTNMALVRRLLLGGLYSLILPANALASSRLNEPAGVSKDAARSNGPQIFNAVHDAMRQWGSLGPSQRRVLFLGYCS